MATKRALKGVVSRETSIRIWFIWNGKRHWETLSIPPTQPNLRHAAKMREEIIKRISIGVFDYAEFFPSSKSAQELAKLVPTFGQMAEKWLGTISHLAPSTIYGYQKMLRNYSLPAFGDKPINTIKYSDIASFLGGINWSSMKTRNNVATTIRQPFELAFYDGIIEANPAARLKNMSVQKDPPDPFAINEMELILASLKEHCEPEFYNYFEFAFFTGMRTSELAGLQWSDIDFMQGTAQVNKALVNGVLKETKTYEVRDIELNSRALSALSRQKNHTFIPGKFIFLNPKTKEPLHNDKVTWRPWQHAVKLSGVRYRKPYNTRHTFATMNLMAGALPMWVARQMGHKTMKMLLDNYSRWIDQADKQREKNKLETLLATGTK